MARPSDKTLKPMPIMRSQVYDLGKIGAGDWSSIEEVCQVAFNKSSEVKLNTIS